MIWVEMILLAIGGAVVLGLFVLFGRMYRYGVKNGLVKKNNDEEWGDWSDCEDPQKHKEG